MERRRPGLVGPLILITIGILFLLANFGLLPLSFWELASRYWPLILILAGLDMVFGRRSVLGGLIVLALWSAIIAGVLWVTLTFGSAIVSPTQVVTDQLNQPLDDIKGATIDLNIGMATTNVTALGSDTTDLMKGTFSHRENARVVKTYTIVGGEGRLALREDGLNWLPLGIANTRWDIALNQQLPLALRINGGVGRANLDLEALNVTTMNLDVGVGTIQVNAPKAGVTAMRINGGVGNVIVRIPTGVAGRIRASNGIGSIRVDESRFPKFGSTFSSSDYAAATNRIDIDIDGGVGNIEVR